MKTTHWFASFFASVWLLCLLAIQPVGLLANEPVSRPGEYAGYSEPIYDMSVRSSVHVPGHDGTLLAVDIHRPSHDGLVPVSEPLPAILVSHPALSRRYLSTGQNLIPYGYVVVALDLRGMGASFGQRHGDFSQDERLDLGAVIEWIAAQSWCDGYVGMIGNSYSGSLQHMAATTQPPHLIATIPSSAVYDTYQQFYPNGVADLPTLGPPPISLSGVPVDEDVPPDYPLLAAAIESHYGSTSELEWREPGMFRDAWSDDTQNMPPHRPQPADLRRRDSGVRCSGL